MKHTKKKSKMQDIEINSREVRLELALFDEQQYSI
jgi:hypothetical protein